MITDQPSCNVLAKKNQLCATGTISRGDGTAAEERFISTGDCAIRYMLRGHSGALEFASMSRRKVHKEFESAPESDFVAPNVEHETVSEVDH